MKKLDLNKPMRMGDSPARFTGRITHPSTPLVFAVMRSSGVEEVVQRNEYGQRQYCPDVANVVERVVRYVNLSTGVLLKDFDSMGRDVSVVCRTVDRAYPNFSAVKLTFEDGKLVSSEVVR